MSAPTGEVAAVPVEAWPTDTYFTREWDLFVNDEAIRLHHVPRAHTDGDTMVFFRRSDVISAGDIFNTDRYPPFDPERGGGIDGVIEGLNLLLDIAVAGENQTGGTVVIPGHGRLGDETDVANYRDMVTIVRDRIRALIDDGMSLDQVLAERPTRDYDGDYTWAGTGRSGDEFVAAVYRSLSAE
jgi:glyoxylase-like metal-dependent hydrolase (beta-lactamase superfamily II)